LPEFLLAYLAEWGSLVATASLPLPMERSIFVVGGGGFYGRYLVADLLKQTQAPIVVAGRNPTAPFAESGRVTAVRCDLNDLTALKTAAQGSRLIMHCAGPFQYLPLNPLFAAMELGIDYIDIAEDREFARRAAALAPQIETAGITVLTGISVAPAMEALFTQLLRPHFRKLLSTRTFAAPDTRKHRGEAMFHTMLYGVGRKYQQPRQGQMVTVYGWGEPEWITFPPPVGRRLTHLVLEMADLDLLPTLFGLETVEFKAGTEHVILNRTLNLAARMRARWGWPVWERFTPFVRALSWLVGRIGKDEGGVIFEIGGLDENSQPRLERVAVMAEKDGGRIPSALAGMAAVELLDSRLTQKGLLPVHNWIGPTRLIAGLQARDLQLWRQRQPDEEWRKMGNEGWTAHDE
jgi:hypothetical protein